jgi:hypothetical protein
VKEDDCDDARQGLLTYGMTAGWYRGTKDKGLHKPDSGGRSKSSDNARVTGGTTKRKQERAVDRRH